MTNSVKNFELTKVLAKDNDKSLSPKEQKQRIEQKLKSLMNQKSEFSSSDVASLRNQANALENIAALAEKIADAIEKGKVEKLDKKKKEDIKKVLMQQLGIPAEFVDQLGLLSKAGPDALREAASVYRSEANNRRAEADLKATEIDNINRSIEALEQARDRYSAQTNNDQQSVQNFINKGLREQIVRDNAEEEYHQALIQAEVQSNKRSTVSL